ncbi:polysaccharide deacetylase family protein [Paramagnetospirillum magneticum]|nr:polysaccharide deacetylase family protein [Paramagnetospirillum magneticum]
MRRFVMALCLVLVPEAALAWPSWLSFGTEPKAVAPRSRPPGLDFGDKSKAGDCAITFDDGPGPHTGVLLELLATHKVKATFFVLGQHARAYPDLIRRMLAEGHEVENHSWDHPDMRKLDEAARRKEIEDTMAQLKSLGADPHFFRPPYGAYDPALVELARKEGLEVVLWSRDSEDWRYHSVSAIEGNILPAGQGAHGIFLFHDIHDSTIAAMGGVLDDLGAHGCRFVTMGQYRIAAAVSPDQAPTRPTEPHQR